MRQRHAMVAHLESEVENVVDTDGNQLLSASGLLNLFVSCSAGLAMDACHSADVLRKW